MNRKYIAAIVAALVLGTLWFYLYVGHEAPPGQPPLAELRPDNFTTIATAFNAGKDEVRVVLMLSPT